MDDLDYPRKIFINKLLGSTLSSVWICGKIEQTVGTDILIVNDSSGRAKITGCDSAYRERDTSWIRKGCYCCVIGTLVKNKGLPEIQANKIINISSNEISKNIWETEVESLDLFLDGKMEPDFADIT